MKINIFKDKEIWKYLEQFNKEVIEVANTVKYPGCSYDTEKGEASNWFDPNKIKLTPIANTEYYPKPHPKQLDPKYNLILHTANYPTLFVTNLLYGDKKEEIIFEDICCGQSQLSFYLAKLGFKNFNLIDNFCQMPRELLVGMMNKTNTNYSINYLGLDSTVYNLVGYPMFPKRKNGLTNYLYSVLEPPPDDAIIPNSLELFCCYICPERLTGIDAKAFLERFGFVCCDSDSMLYVYGIKNKVDEFREKLKPFEVL